MKTPFFLLNQRNKLSGQNILNLLIEFSYLAVIFVIPIWFAYWFPSYNIFEFNKLIVFKIFVCLLLLFTILKLIFYPLKSGFLFKKFFKKYFLIPTILIVGLSLSLLESTNLLVSFYGTIERQAGLISYLFYFLWFILFIFNVLNLDNFRSLNQAGIHGKLKRIIVTIFFSGTLVSLYAVLQILNIDFLTWPEAPWLTHRAFSTFGQPNFLASWLLFVIPVGFYLFFTNKKFLIKFFYLLAASLQVLALFLTGSRGGLLGLLFAATLFLIYLLIKITWSKRRKFLVIILFVILFLSSLFVLDYSSHGRVRQLANLNYGSLGARFNFYQAAGNAIIDKPVWGYGLENSGEVFIKYYLPDWAVYGNVGQNADRAHNFILDILLTTGVFGLILLSFYYYFFFNLIRDNLKNDWHKNLSLALGLGASGYLFSLLFSFSFVAAEIYFWLFLALIVIINFIGNHDQFVISASLKSLNLVSLENKLSNTKINIKKILKIIIAIFLTIFIFWQISKIFKTLIADYYFHEINLTLNEKNYPLTLELDSYLLSEKPNPINQTSYYLFLGGQLSENFTTINNTLVQGAVKQKLQEIDKFLPASGYKNLLAKAKINLALNNFSQAQTYLLQIIKETPFWPLVYLENGKLAYAQGNFKNALLNYHLAALNLPSPQDQRLNEDHRRDVLNYQYFTAKQIAEVYEAQNNYSAAEKYYQSAYQYNPDDFILLKKIADTYYERGDLKSAINYLIRGKIRSPQDYHWPFSLAVLFSESGDFKSSYNYISEALKLSPQNNELLNFQSNLIKDNKIN